MSPSRDLLVYMWAARLCLSEFFLLSHRGTTCYFAQAQLAIPGQAAGKRKGNASDALYASLHAPMALNMARGK